MDHSLALWWLFLNIIATTTIAFFSMQEMACISFNKMRLNYYVQKGNQRAIWLNYLLEKPIRLFGTTLIGVNAAMFIGSECAREFHRALDLNPDLSPLSQVFFVFIFGELAPMFAARRYPESVAMIGAPLLYFSAKILSPFVWCIKSISNFIDWITGSKDVSEHIVLNQEDLQKLLSLQEDDGFQPSEKDAASIAQNIFSLKNKTAKDVMQPLHLLTLLPSNATVKYLKQILKKHNVDYIPLFHREVSHIIGIITPRNLIRISDSKRLKEYADTPWFITQQTKITKILHEFRKNNKNVAIVLDAQGHAIGMITLDLVTEEIFGKMTKEGNIVEDSRQISQPILIDRTFPADLKIEDFNREFGVSLKGREGDTLADLFSKHLGHHPEIGDTLYLPPFDLTVKETSLLEIKKIVIKTRNK